ncbi:putative choline dehydrogenase [Bisporella sp. PMI_857]|nr:putative choline dehydrogenase [Bisporella sp. PMI_857]
MQSLGAAVLLLTLVRGILALKTPQYEYIVIGSGPGGGPLAANLARAGHSVLLLEAGGDNGEALTERMPALATINAEGSDASWEFFVSHFQNETQAKRDNKFTYLLSNGSYYVGIDPPADAEPLGIYYPRGATVGGSSQVNAMNFALPPDDDWKIIANLTGDDSWLPEKVRTHFIELERNLYLPGSPEHGYGGYVSTNLNNISYFTARPGLVDISREITRRLEGIEIDTKEQLVELLARDVNTDSPQRYEIPGIRQIAFHINERRERHGARTYIIDTVKARSHDGTQAYPLTLSTNSLATRVLFHQYKGKKPQAYGVEYLVGEAMFSADRRYNSSDPGELRHAIATREVIVAGGAFNTPQILKLSGVGPRNELEKLGIPIVADIPAVGKYMQDNYESGITVRANIPWENNPYTGCSIGLTLDPSADPCLAQWINGDGGPYGQGGTPLYIWFRSSVSKTADADIFFFGAPDAEFRGHYPGWSQHRAPNTTFFWSMVKMQVGNQAGTVNLRSANPRDSPIIEFNYFEQQDAHDLQALAEGAEFALDVFNSLGEPYTPFEVVEPARGVELQQSIKDHAFGHHVTSTCRMGPKDDPEYCVDSKFRVNGVERLRVVDASIFPRTPGAFPVAPTFVISQMAFRNIQDGL